MGRPDGLQFGRWADHRHDGSWVAEVRMIPAGLHRARQDAGDRGATFWRGQRPFSSASPCRHLGFSRGAIWPARRSAERLSSPDHLSGRKAGLRRRSAFGSHTAAHHQQLASCRSRETLFATPGGAGNPGKGMAATPTHGEHPVRLCRNWVSSSCGRRGRTPSHRASRLCRSSVCPSGSSAAARIRSTPRNPGPRPF